jgi:hypothetical protein
MWDSSMLLSVAPAISTGSLLMNIGLHWSQNETQTITHLVRWLGTWRRCSGTQSSYISLQQQKKVSYLILATLQCLEGTECPM